MSSKPGPTIQSWSADTLFWQVLIDHNMVITEKHPHNILMMFAYSSSVINLFFTLNSDIPEDVLSLREFTTAMIVAATSKCLRLIKDDLQIPSVLPASMSSKFRLGTTLATACQVCLVIFTYGVWSALRIKTFLKTS